MRLLLDADAFLCLRKHDLIDILIAAPKVELLMTGFVARRELNSIETHIKEMECSKALTVYDVRTKSPEFDRYRSILRTGVHKGEAESVAWAIEKTTGATRPVFVSLDVRARKMAAANGLKSLDVFDLMVVMERRGLCKLPDIRSRLGGWDDDPHGFCRPPGFTTFDETWRKRSSMLGGG